MEKNVFGKFPKLNILMLIMCVVDIVVFMFDGNWVASIWAFNTAIWCAMEGTDNMQISELRDKISDLLDEKFSKSI